MNTITCKSIKHISSDGNTKVSALVDGEPLWFQSSDTDLYPSHEAFACALLTTAMMNKSSLAFDFPLSPQWLNNSKQLMAIFNKWWKYPAIDILCKKTLPSKPKTGNGTALLFSGGVDSFYTLLRSNHNITHLVYIHGYDIALQDTRINTIEYMIRNCAKELNCKSIIIKTNLREHSFFRKSSWTDFRGWLRIHGGCLAAIGHLIPDVKHLLISASFPYMFDIPWGSHWKIDSLWESEQLKIHHVGADTWRTDKLRDIASENIVQKYLHVCTNANSTTFNCCYCEKCIRTMIILEGLGLLKHYKLFPKQDKLDKAIDALPFVAPYKIQIYKNFIPSAKKEEIQKSLKRLVFRSKKKAFLLSRVGKLLANLWLILPQNIRNIFKT